MSQIRAAFEWIPRAAPASLCASLLVGALASACTGTDPDVGASEGSEHCFDALGDATCVARDPALPFCAASNCVESNQGCLAELPESSCYSPCGGNMTVEGDDSCLQAGTETGAQTSTTTGNESETETGSESDCLDHIDCPADAPFCFFGSCSPCDATNDPDAACFTVSEGLAPVCLESECVECSADNSGACTELGHQCDLDTNNCYACTSHDECPGQAGCDLALGTCLPEDTVFHVDGAGGRDFSTINDALDALGQGSGTLLIHALANDQSYEEALTIAGDRAVVLRSADPLLPAIDTATLMQVPVTATQGARVYLRELSLAGQPRYASASAGARLELDRCILNSTNAMTVDDATLVMTNSMALTLLGGLDLTGSTALTLSYSTLLVGAANAAVIVCQDGDLAQGSVARNNLLLNGAAAPVLDCDALLTIGNAINGSAEYIGNTALGEEIQVDWFVGLPDMHLSPSAPIGISSAATWSEGDPLTDFDGDPRPNMEGSSDFAGADRLP